MTYDTNAMIPVEVGVPTLRRQLIDLSMNNESLAVNLDLISELCDKARIRDEATKLRGARRYNSKVSPRCFRQGDLVWRMRSHARKDERKFSSNWEGPFHVRILADKGAYRLATLAGKVIPGTWNATHLKFYFS